MSKASRDKGKRGELEVVSYFQAAGLKAHRTAALQTGTMTGVGDVTVEAHPQLHVEVKRCESYRLPAWHRQVEAARGGRPYIIAYRRSHEPWRAVVDLAWLTKLLAGTR